MARRDLEKLRGQLAQVKPAQPQRVDTQTKDFDPAETAERISKMTPDEIKQHWRECGDYPAPGIAPGPHQLPNPDDYERMTIHSQIALYFAQRKNMAPAEWQRRYTQLLEAK